MLALARALKAQTIDYAERLRLGGRYHAPEREADLNVHLREAVEWLRRAHDAGDNRGVSYGVKFGGPFQESYPETTGYIIPTFLKLADFYQDDTFARRAAEMGEWECDVQMASGAVMGGQLNPNPSPAVFNTGMVLLGWAALYERSGDSRYLEALRRASDWMLSMQDPDGNWRRGNSKFANPQTTVYNVKAAWGLCEAGRVGDIPAAAEGAVRNAEFCLSRQRPNGWFCDCCLIDAERPLLHTIAYAMQGLLGIGVAMNRQDFVDAAALTADGLQQLMDGDGFIPGCIDRNFKGAVDWCCLTGTAQTAIVWGRLFQLTGDATYRDAMCRANRYLIQRHDIDNPDPRLRGGVPGSWPVWGSYGRLMILNWATNFFVESLLLQAGTS